MLLLAGFLLAGAAIMAIGAMTMVQRSETQLSAQEHQSMFNLFTNTRDRAITYFEVVDVRDTAASVDEHLDGYLQSQFQTARALSMDLNATLAGPDTRASMDETDFLDNPSGPSGPYQDPDGGNLWDTKSRDCYSSVSYDGKNDGLITNSNGKVLGAIFWLKLEASGASLEEFVVIDVPSTNAPAC